VITSSILQAAGLGSQAQARLSISGRAGLWGLPRRGRVERQCLIWPLMAPTRAADNSGAKMSHCDYFPW
jgi:hypothetical protein